jgi:hypothetical protein
MTNELSSFDEFNGISSCLDNTIRFLSQLSKKWKKMLYFCHDVDIQKVDFYSRSWKNIFLALNFRLAVIMLQLIYALKMDNNWRFPTPAQPRISFERAILRLEAGNSFT